MSILLGGELASASRTKPLATVSLTGPRAAQLAQSLRAWPMESSDTGEARTVGYFDHGLTVTCVGFGTSQRCQIAVYAYSKAGLSGKLPPGVPAAKNVKAGTATLPRADGLKLVQAMAKYPAESGDAGYAITTGHVNSGAVMTCVTDRKTFGNCTLTVYAPAKPSRR